MNQKRYKMESFTIEKTFKVNAQTLYSYWLSSEKHSEMTGGTAECSEAIGAKHLAWDGYIWGENVELIPGKKIVQTWRTIEFDDNDADSIITITFSKKEEGCVLILQHKNIPSGQKQYEKGWIDHYFTPMEEYFG